MSEATPSMRASRVPPVKFETTTVERVAMIATTMIISMSEKALVFLDILYILSIAWCMQSILCIYTQRVLITGLGVLT